MPTSSPATSRPTACCRRGGYEAGWGQRLGRGVASNSIARFGWPAPFAAGLEDRIVEAVHELVEEAKPTSASAFDSRTEYLIETLAGNGEPGDIPAEGGVATQVPVGLPFGVENGPDGALYITTIGTHRVLRLDRQSGELTSVAGNGRRGYEGDGGPAMEAS
jgi:hypothetical protein